MSDKVTVLVNPQTKQPTGFEPCSELTTPRFFDGPYQNVTVVTREWQQAEMQRVYAALNEKHPEWRRANG